MTDDNRRYFVESTTDPETKIVTYKVVDIVADVTYSEGHPSFEIAQAEAAQIEDDIGIGYR